VIETERLFLRLPEASDAAAIAEQLGDAEVMRYLGRRETGDLEDAVEQLAKMRRAWEFDGFGGFVVELKADGAAIGRVGLLVWDPESWRNGTRAEIGDHAEIELGWTLARSAWGRGYATEAAAAVRDWALHEVRPRRIISLIHPENVRSMRVATKIGEHFERGVTTDRGIDVQLWTL
jgi:RimJ/RimL family protein N-acetyltransferase